MNVKLNSSNIKSEMPNKNPLVITMVVGLSSLLPLPLTAEQINRTVLPVPEPKQPTITELDARNVKPPPRFEVKAPNGAPNVVVVLLDDIGFGQSSAFGGPWPAITGFFRSIERSRTRRSAIPHRPFEGLGDGLGLSGCR